MEIIHIGSRIVNQYLLKTDIGYLAIDTGYPGKFSQYCRGLQKKNIALRDIKWLLLTHTHDDHVGFINEFLAETSALVIADILSPAKLSAGHNPQIGGCTTGLSRFAVKAMDALGIPQHIFPKVILSEDSILWDRQSQPLREKGIPADLVFLQGHTADSIGVLTDTGEFFCGDAAMNGFPSVRRRSVWMEDLQQYTASWDILIHSGANMLYPGHGKPFPPSDLVKYKKYLKNITIS